MALDEPAFAMLKRIADEKRWKFQVLSATTLTLPALFAAVDPSALAVIVTDAHTPEQRFLSLLALADIAVRGYCLDIVGSAQ